MKKILLGLIVVALIFGLTACSQDQYQALGDAMGNMSGNIYGITANLKDVENATNKVDGAVAVDGDGVRPVGNEQQQQPAEHEGQPQHILAQLLHGASPPCMARARSSATLARLRLAMPWRKPIMHRLESMEVPP